MTKQNRRNFFKKIGLGFFSFSVLGEINLFSGIREIFKKPPLVYFTTGFKVSEVTTDAAVIWTRLCSQEIPNPVVHKRKESVFRHPVDFDEDQPVGSMDGGVRGGTGIVRVKIYNEEEEKVSEWMEAVAEEDFTIKMAFEGLKEGTQYQVELEGKLTLPGPSTFEKGVFRTAPDPGSVHPVLLVTSTCQYFWSFDDEKRGFRTYDSMRRMKPDFFIQTGDYVYYDKPGPLAKDLEKARHKWHAMDSWLSIREMYREVPIYMLKDDHDLLKDDAYPGSEPYGHLTFEDGLKLWYENVPIQGKPYRTVRRGKDLQIWMVEGREYRSPNTEVDSSGKSIWGEEQKKWFRETVEASDATFKLLFTATPVVGPDRKNKKDNHSNETFATEGEWLREYLSRKDGMYVVNGDRHWQYVSRDPETGLMEFGSGPISDFHAQGWDPDDYRPEHRFLRLKGGFLSIRVDRENGKPFIIFNHRDVDGNAVHEERYSGY